VPTGFIRSVVAIVAVWLASCAAIPAQDYPTRTIRVIIPLGPGGGGDVFTRALADELQKALGQPVVVENRTGGALNIGTRACAEAAPDGYTICVLSSEPVVYNQFLFKSLPFDPEKDFEPISNLFFNTLALVVNNSLKLRTIADLVALSKARPGRLSYGTFSFPLAHSWKSSRRRPARTSYACHFGAATKSSMRSCPDPLPSPFSPCPTWSRSCKAVTSPALW
jgi:tripartite-type tricarboxylate transporter receptor subunit TctC